MARPRTLAALPADWESICAPGDYRGRQAARDHAIGAALGVSARTVRQYRSRKDANGRCLAPVQVVRRVEARARACHFPGGDPKDRLLQQAGDTIRHLLRVIEHGDGQLTLSYAHMVRRKACDMGWRMLEAMEPVAGVPYTATALARPAPPDHLKRSLEAFARLDRWSAGGLATLTQVPELGGVLRDREGVFDLYVGERRPLPVPLFNDDALGSS